MTHQHKTLDQTVTEIAQAKPSRNQLKPGDDALRTLAPKNFGGYGAIVFAMLVVAGLATIPAVTLVLVVYFMPLIIAMSRNSPHSAPLMALNLFLGWTLIGWVAALCWALMPIKLEQVQ